MIRTDFPKSQPVCFINGVMTDRYDRSLTASKLICCGPEVPVNLIFDGTIITTQGVSFQCSFLSSLTRGMCVAFYVAFPHSNFSFSRPPKFDGLLFEAAKLTFNQVLRSLKDKSVNQGIVSSIFSSMDSSDCSNS